MPTSVEMRRAIEADWRRYASSRGGLFASDRLSGSSPPSVFVGSAGYPRLDAGPMLPPDHGDTSLLDSPERWAGRGLEEIVRHRLSLVRGVRRVDAGDTSGRYVRSLQELAMSGGPSDSDLRFEAAAAPAAVADGYSPPFGPVGRVRDASFHGLRPPVRQVERAYYDTDLGAAEAVVGMYDAGVEVSRIQRCFSAGMVGRRRRLVPTKWGITATDDAISSALISRVLDAPLADSHRVHSYAHMGNLFCIVLFPHMWIYEMIEAWHAPGGAVGFGADSEDARGRRGRPPSIAGAYHAARLAAAEHLAAAGVQAGVLVLREVRPEYAVPVGVWQVREGVREALRAAPVRADGFREAVEAACARTSISAKEWMAHGRTLRLARQRDLSEFF